MSLFHCQLRLSSGCCISHLSSVFFRKRTTWSPGLSATSGVGSLFWVGQNLIVMSWEDHQAETLGSGPALPAMRFGADGKEGELVSPPAAQSKRQSAVIPVCHVKFCAFFQLLFEDAFDVASFLDQSDAPSTSSSR